MPTPGPSGLVRRLRAPGYLILVITMVLPMVDLLLNVFPWHPNAVQWRFGFVGFFSSAIGAPLLVLLLIYALALMSGDRKVIIVVGVLAALILLSILASAGAFALDALQMKGRIQPARQTQFLVACAQAMLKLFLQGSASIVLAVNIFRTVRNTKPAPIKTDKSASLLLGRPSSAKPVVSDALPGTGPVVGRPVDG